MQTIVKSRVKRILFITLSNLGDIILTLPVLDVLSKTFPEAEIDVMSGPQGADLFHPHKDVSNFIRYDKKISFVKKYGLFRELRKKRYDLVVDVRNTVLPFVLGARYRTRAIRHAAGDVPHKRDVHLSRLKEMGINSAGAQFHIPVTDHDRRHVDGLLRPVKGQPFIVVSPGAKSHVKRWPLKHYSRLCDMLAADPGLAVILIGDGNDAAVVRRVLFHMNTRPVDLTGKTNVRELAYLIGKSSLLITNDSAPLHIGSATGVPTLAFFGPTDPGKYGPLIRDKSSVLKTRLPCSPCEVAQCANIRHRYACLRDISAEEAVREARRLLTLGNR
jgi:ADP-heptose:LPS heptosyltransferase